MDTVIRAAALLGYRELVKELGADPEPFLSRFHIQPGVEYQEDAFVSFQATVRLFEASAAGLDCPDFGLRLARWQGLHILGPIAVIARNAQTVLGGLESIARYLHVHSPAMKLTVARTTEADVGFTYEITDPPPLEIPQGYELSMADAVRMIRLLGGPDARPSSVSFVHGQLGSDAAYREALGCTVLFGQPSCGFELPLELADRRIQGADAETRRIATKYMEAQYVPSSAALSERVAELARKLLPTGQCSAEVIADELAMHPRTLQRRLADEGLSCQELIERVRRNQAAKYLAEPGLHLSQIAGLLGYAEQSTLNRSCRRWFGMTPRQYRADLPPPIPRDLSRANLPDADGRTLTFAAPAGHVGSAESDL